MPKRASRRKEWVYNEFLSKKPSVERWERVLLGRVTLRRGSGLGRIVETRARQVPRILECCKSLARSQENVPIEEFAPGALQHCDLNTS
jgi:hypothetical protein